MTSSIVADILDTNSKKIYSSSFDLNATLTKLDVPVKNKWLVYLYEKASGLLVNKSYTDENGNFNFKNIDRKKDYFIIAFDKERIYNSITYDLTYGSSDKFTALPTLSNPTLVPRDDQYIISLVKHIVNKPYLLTSMSFTSGYKDDLGFSWNSSDTNSTTYQYNEDLHCLYFRNTNYIYNRTKSFNNVGEPSTVEFWVKPFSNTSNRAIASSRISDGVGHQYIGLTGTTNKILLNRPANVFEGATELVYESNASLTLDVFTHVAVVFTGDTLRIYINGQLDSSKEDVLGLPFNVNGIELGYSSFTGYIAGFKLFNSVVYSENFKPTKDLVLMRSVYEDPNDLYAENVLLKLGFPTYFKSYIARDLAKNAFLTQTVLDTTAFSVSTNGLFETINQTTDLTFRKKQFTFDIVFKTTSLSSSSRCLFSNANITTASIDVGQWGVFAGTSANPNKYVLKTLLNEYPLNYNFILNEVVIFRVIKDYSNYKFYINNSLVGEYEITESIGNSKDKFCYGTGSFLQIFDLRYTELCRPINDVLSTEYIPSEYFSTLSYSYNLSSDISNLGFGFLKENPITSSEVYYSPDHSLYLDGLPLRSLEFSGDSFVKYDYTFAIQPLTRQENNVLFSVDKEEHYLKLSLTDDFKIKLNTIDNELVSSVSLSTSEFNLITVTYDLSVLRVYVNGIQQLNINKVVANTRGSSIVIADKITGYLDDLSFYRNKVVHTENFVKPTPLPQEVFNSISNIQNTPTTKYYLDFSLSNPNSNNNAYYDSKLNSNWNIFYNWIYATPDKWLSFYNTGGIYYSNHSFYHNKNSFFSMSTRIRHIVGSHNANGWTVLIYHNYNFYVYLNRVTGAVMCEFYNGSTYLAGTVIGYSTNFLFYKEFDLTITFQNGKVWVHIDKELIGSALSPSNWTNTYNNWFGLGAPGSGSYPIGYYELKYFRYDLNNTEFPEINMEYLSDKLGFKLNCSSENTVVGKATSQMLFDNSIQRTTWINNGTVTAASLIPFDNTTSLSFNGLTQYLSSGNNPKTSVGTLPFTFKFKVHLSTGKEHCILSSGGNSKINILEDGTFKIVTKLGYEYTSEYALESLRPYSIQLTRKKDLINIYVNNSLKDVLVVNTTDEFDFNENSITRIGSDLTNYLNGNLTYISFYSGSSLSPEKIIEEVPIFNYLSYVEFTAYGIKDINAKNVWSPTGTITSDSSLKQFKKYSKTFSSSFYSLPNSTDWATGTSNFTIECTFRLTSMPTSTYYGVYGNWISNTGFCLFIRPGGILDFRINDTIPIATANSCIKINQWTTITIVKEGSKVSAYYNGTLIFNGSSSSSLTSSNGPCIGRNKVSTDFFNGQIESFKFLKKAVHPTPNSVLTTKSNLEDTVFTTITKPYLNPLENEIINQFSTDSIYDSGYLEIVSGSLKLYSNKSQGVKYYFNKTKNNFETLNLKTKFSQNIFGISLQDNTEIQFTSESISIIKGISKEIISIQVDVNSLNNIKIIREVNLCYVYLNGTLVYSGELFNDLEEYKQYLYFNSSSNSLTYIELIELDLINTYPSSVYLYSPLKTNTLDFVANNTQEITTPVFVNGSLQVNQKTLQLNLKAEDVAVLYNNTLRFNLAITKYGQDLLSTESYILRINNQGAIEVFSNNTVILIASTSITLNTFVEISLEKYKSSLLLFIDRSIVGVNLGIDDNWTITNFVLGDTGSDYFINNLIFIQGSYYYEAMLKDENNINDYNFKKLTKTSQTSSLLSFEENTTKDDTGRVWTAVGISPTTVNNKSPIIGKSLYINGTDDYIMTNAGAISGGSAPFSLEMIVCPDYVQPPNGNSAGGTSQTAGGSLFAQNYNTGSGEQHLSWSKDTGRLAYSIGSVRGGGALSSLSTINSAPKGHWTKVVLSYDGKTMRLFLNGRLEKSISYATGWINNGSKIRLGHCLVEGYSDYRMSFSGYFDEVRIIDGKCEYFKDFSRKDTNLISYLSFDDITSSTAAFDNKGNGWSASGLTYNTGTKYLTSYSSAYFNGNTKISCSDTSLFNFVKENFAIKIRFYPTDALNYLVMFSNNSADTANLLSITIASNVSSLANKVYFYYYSQNIVSNRPVNYNAWNEVIVERDGTFLRISLNGDVNTVNISADQQFNYSYNGGASIGTPNYTTNSNYKGYIDSLAVYKGTTLIPTSNTPVLNLPLEYNVFDLDNLDTNWSYNNIQFAIINGKPCCYFNGVDSYLYSTNAKLNLGTEDFIIKFELCAKSFSNLFGRIIATQKGSETSSKQYVMLTGSNYSLPANKQSFYFGQQDNDQNIFSTGFTANILQWYSVEIIRKSGVVTFYVNGDKYASATMNKVINFMENGGVYIGASSNDLLNTSQFLNAYLCNFKIYKGISTII